MITHCDFQEVLAGQLSFLYGKLNERDRRLLLGCTAALIGRGGAAFVRRATGAAKATVTRSLQELRDAGDPLLDGLNLCLEDDTPDDGGAMPPGESIPTAEDEIQTMRESPVRQEKPGAAPGEREELRTQRPNTYRKKPEGERIRKPGGGRKSSLCKYPDLPERIDSVILSSGKGYGSPERELKYTTLSVREIARMIREDGTNPIEVSHNVISRTLDYLGYHKRLNAKMPQTGAPCPDRNAQFEFMNRKGIEFLAAGDPVVSIDTGKLPEYFR